MTRGGALRVAAGLGISVLCIGLLFTLVRGENVGQSLASGAPIVLVPAVMLYFVGTLIRSVRWNLLLGGKLSNSLLFRTLVIGLMLNDLLPGRLGEVARIYLLARNAEVPVGASIASIVVERVLDGIALITLLAIGVVLAAAGGVFQASAFKVLFVAMAFVTPLFLVVSIVLLWAARRPAPARRLFLWLLRPLPRRLQERVAIFIDSIILGLAPIGRSSTSLLVFLLSLVAWIVESSMYLVIMLGFHVVGGPAAAMLGAAAANLATLVPSSPGYIGTFDLALRQVLVGVFGNSGADATSLTLVVHLALIVPVVLLGLFFVWREDISLPELKRRV